MVAKNFIFRGAAWTVLALSFTACSNHVQTDRYGTSGYKHQTTSNYNYSSQAEFKATRYGGTVYKEEAGIMPCGITLQPCGYVVQYVAVQPPALRPQIECCEPPIIPEPPTPPLPPVITPPTPEPPIPEPPIYEPPITYPPIDTPEPPVWLPPKK